MSRLRTQVSPASISCCSGGLLRNVQRARGRAEISRSSSVQRPARIVRIGGGRVRVGDNASPLPQDGECPSRMVMVKPFAIDPYAVTNAWFSDFVAATHYQTDAERYGWSLVFEAFSAGAPDTTEGLGAPSWWRRVDGTCWRHPEGPNSNISERANHPVVHVSWNDACAFAAWMGGRLPSEAEWECAARGALANARFPWGDQEPDDDRFQPCNIWQGGFPSHNTRLDGHAGTAPVDSFAPNSAGLFNMVGNTWEWCADAFRIRSLARISRLRNDAARAAGEHLLKGGSYLCHRSYCYRYRIAARTGVGPDTSTGHVGFRVVFDD